jgi:predicted glycosyltransferase
MELFRALAGQRVDAVVGFPGFQTALVGRTLGIPSLGAYDDAEHRPNLLLAKLSCDVLMLPEQLDIRGGNIRTCRALKEWAYLAPKYFTPRSAALSEHGLDRKGYVFVREIEPRSLNYREQGDRIPIVEALYRAGLNRERVVLSLEDKRRRHLYPRWQILEEPVSDIRSLLYHASLVISSGDSMAREAAQLGVPSVYAGDRRMKANDVLYGMGLMHQISNADELLSRLPSLRAPAPNGAARTTPAADSDPQESLRADLAARWDDPAEVLIQALYSLVGAGIARGS